MSIDPALPSLPLAEEFHSLQGEGRWTGTPMHFVRLAGCSVGRLRDSVPDSLSTSPSTSQDAIPILKTGAPAWECCTYDRRHFWCDTDFNRHAVTPADELLDDTWEGHLCITGGEPYIHARVLEPILTECVRRGIMVHIETSGTIHYEFTSPIWISCSPKHLVLADMIVRANEIKLLVDQAFDLNQIPYDVKRHQRVYVQPVNEELTVNRANFDKCMEILRIRPDWHMSMQAHKLLGLR